MKIILGVVIIFCFWSRASWGETMCWPEDANPGFWMTISGIPVFAHPSWDSPPLNNFGANKCADVDIPHPVCLSQLSPWVIEMQSRLYRDVCCFDMDGDGVIGLDDLGATLNAFNETLGQSCEPIR